MPTRVKICGVTRAEDAELAVELGAAALGFNSYAPSPRYITPAKAREITRRLPPFVMSVGVFADEPDTDRILAVAREAGLNAIQVRGPRLPDLGRLLEQYPLIVAVPVHGQFQAAELGALQASAFLLDGFDPQLLGGTGKTFDWKVAREARRYGRIILAGGLTPENVGSAIRAARPFAVDVASGVESSPGVKDPGKLRAFLTAVEESDRNIEQFSD
jgi:phosphoribosylanthranilate isomerase